VKNVESDDAVGEALAELGLAVRYDRLRKPDAPRWTVAIPGVGRGDGYSPKEAAAALRASLLRHVVHATGGP